MPYDVNRHPVSHLPETNDIERGITVGAGQEDPLRAMNVLTNIDSLMVGDMVDIFDSVQVWAEAEILKIDRQLGNVFITYLSWDNSWDEWIRVGDRRIAKLHTYTYIEGKSFQIGQRIEVRDTRNVWLEAFITDMDYNSIKVHYKGWSMKFDEWLDMHDLRRIRPFGRSKRGLQIKRKEGRLFKIPHSGDGANGSSSDFDAAQAKKPSKPGDDKDPENINSEYKRRISESSAHYNQYKSSLLRLNLKVVPVSGDGNCLFRSVAHQVYGDEELHDIVREKCMDYMELNASFFSQFVEGGLPSFHLYIRAKRASSCWGDDPEIQSLCELYNRPADIWAYDHQRGARKLRTFHEAASQAGTDSTHSFSRPTMRLSYYGGGHYDSIVNNNEDGSNLLRLVPGEMEDKQLEFVRRSRLRSAEGSSSLEEAKRSTDREETERVTLELAIQRSRAEHLRWAEEDLESCLINSFSTININSNSKRELEGDGSDAASIQRGEHKEGKCAKLGDADVAHTQIEMMRSAKDESERLSIEHDLLEGAKSASLADAKDGLLASDDKGDADLKLALSLSQEEQLQAAISASLRDTSARDGDDDLMLQALQMSMNEFGAADAGGGDEDEELSRAIEMSLRGGQEDTFKPSRYRYHNNEK